MRRPLPSAIFKRLLLPVLLAAASILTPQTARAQFERYRGVPLATIEYQRLQDLKLALSSEEQNASQERALNFDNLRITGSLPVPLRGNDTLLIPTIRFEHLWVAPETAPSLRLGIFDTRLTLRQALGSGWSFAPSVNLGFASNFEGLGSRDLFGGGSLVVTKALADGTVILGGGLALTAAADGILPVPLVIIRWCPRPDFWLAVAAPAVLDIGYAPSQRIELGLRARINGIRYTLRGIDGVEAVRNATFTAGPSLAIRLIGGFHLRLTGGAASLIQLDLQRTRSDDLVVSSGDSLSWFASASVEFRVFPSARKPAAIEDD
ncbi:MAG: DUF6268 family outer membrane beta-barrel protein [Myxococcota bacterium]